MNQRFEPSAGGTSGGAVEGPRQPAVDRRDILRGAGGLALAGLSTGLAGCVSSEPEPEPFDPRSLVYPPPPEQPRYYYDNMLLGSGNVVEVSSTDKFRRFATGQAIRGQGFSKPFGVAARNGRIFVSDSVARRVHLLDFPGKNYKAIGTEGVGRLAKPLGLTTDVEGNLYVVDGTAKRVLVYDPNGTYATAIGIEDSLQRPTAVVVSPDRQRIYVLDSGGIDSREHRVVIYDRQGKILSQIGKRGKGDGEFNLPLDLALDAEGKLYVLDTGNFRVQVFRPDGSFDHAFGKAGRFHGQFSHPKGIAIDSAGIIYATDTSFGVFQLFNLEGRVLMAIGERSEQAGPGKFLLPAGITTDVDRRIYVVDQWFRKVEVFRPVDVPEDWPIGQPVAASQQS